MERDLAGVARRQHGLFTTQQALTVGLPARALLLERYGDDVPESGLERAFRSLVRGAGLPEPTPQVTIADAAGFIARVDFAYPDRRVAIELDSRRHHLHAHAFEADRAPGRRGQPARRGSSATACSCWAGRCCPTRGIRSSGPVQPSSAS